MFDQLDLCDRVANEIKQGLSGNSQIKPQRIGFPAVLGLEKSLQVKEHLENLLGLPVFEIPTLPPSIPGIRLSKILVSAIERLGGRVFEGMQVNSVVTNATQVVEVNTEAASRNKPHRAQNFVLATGGILGGGLRAGFDGKVIETIFQLPVSAPQNRNEWFAQKFLSASGHPIFKTGVSVNRALQPVDQANQPGYENLFIAGNLLAGGDTIQERSRDGVALVTGYYLGNNLK